MLFFLLPTLIFFVITLWPTASFCGGNSEPSRVPLRPENNNSGGMEEEDSDHSLDLSLGIEGKFAKTKREIRDLVAKTEVSGTVFAVRDQDFFINGKRCGIPTGGVMPGYTPQLVATAAEDMIARVSKLIEGYSPEHPLRSEGAVLGILEHIEVKFLQIPHELLVGTSGYSLCPDREVPTQYRIAFHKGPTKKSVTATHPCGDPNNRAKITTSFPRSNLIDIEYLTPKRFCMEELVANMYRILDFHFVTKKTVLLVRALIEDALKTLETKQPAGSYDYLVEVLEQILWKLRLVDPNKKVIKELGRRHCSNNFKLFLPAESSNDGGGYGWLVADYVNQNPPRVATEDRLFH